LAQVLESAFLSVTGIAMSFKHCPVVMRWSRSRRWGAFFAGALLLGGAAQAAAPSIAGGYSHSLALRSNGSVVAWGNNSLGQTTVPATAASGVVAIAAGDTHNLALKADGSVVTWGDNGGGQAASQSIDPLKVRSLAKNDFNGDFVSDVLWRNTGTGNFTASLMRKFSASPAVAAGVAQWTNSVSVGLNAPIVGTADFNNDGKTDILFRNTTTGNAVIGYMGNPGGPVWATIEPPIGLNVQVQSVADFTGDGKADIL
jgi:Regulator of chromosome condensation (RCC1) repeat/FG-GAP-like repeat